MEKLSRFTHLLLHCVFYWLRLYRVCYVLNDSPGPLIAVEHQIVRDFIHLTFVNFDHDSDKHVEEEHVEDHDDDSVQQSKHWLLMLLRCLVYAIRTDHFVLCVVNSLARLNDEDESQTLQNVVEMNVVILPLPTVV